MAAAILFAIVVLIFVPVVGLVMIALQMTDEPEGSDQWEQF